MPVSASQTFGVLYRKLNLDVQALLRVATDKRHMELFPKAIQSPDAANMRSCSSR